MRGDSQRFFFPLGCVLRGVFLATVGLPFALVRVAVWAIGGCCQLLQRFFYCSFLRVSVAAARTSVTGSSSSSRRRSSKASWAATRPLGRAVSSPRAQAAF